MGMKRTERQGMEISIRQGKNMIKREAEGGSRMRERGKNVRRKEMNTKNAGINVIAIGRR
jgi:hypothetical protein